MIYKISPLLDSPVHPGVKPVLEFDPFGHGTSVPTRSKDVVVGKN